MTIRVSSLTARLPFPLARVRRAAGVFLKAQGVLEADLSIVFLTEKAMRELNRKSLGHDYVTDVVTFDLSIGHRAESIEKNKVAQKRHGLGRNKFPALRSKLYVLSSIDAEIYICPAEARRNAKIFGETFEHEVLRYVAHGILHLLGHDDRRPEDRRKIRVHEDGLLALLVPAARKRD